MTEIKWQIETDIWNLLQFDRKSYEVELLHKDSGRRWKFPSLGEVTSKFENCDTNILDMVLCLVANSLIRLQYKESASDEDTLQLLHALWRFIEKPIETVSRNLKPGNSR
jgi:hypothetical protein